MGFFPSTGSWWWTSRTQTTPCKEYSLQLCLCSKWWEWYSVPISLAPNRSSGTWTLAPNSVQKYIPARGVTGAENQDNKRQGEELKTHCLACLCFTDLNAATYGCLMYPPEKFPGGGYNYIPGGWLAALLSRSRCGANFTTPIGMASMYSFCMCSFSSARTWEHSVVMWEIEIWFGSFLTILHNVMYCQCVDLFSGLNVPCNTLQQLWIWGTPISWSNPTLTLQITLLANSTDSNLIKYL